MSRDLEVNSESARCWGKKFQLYSNYDYVRWLPRAVSILLHCLCKCHELQNEVLGFCLAILVAKLMLTRIKQYSHLFIHCYFFATLSSAATTKNCGEPQ